MSGASQVGRRGEHGFERQVVHDVDGRDAIPLGEGAVHDLAGGDNGHRAGFSS